MEVPATEKQQKTQDMEKTFIIVSGICVPVEEYKENQTTGENQ
jgi:hypothetical protein